MISRSTFDFLSQLQDNNNREWFQEHKALYISAKDELAALMAQLIPIAAKYDPLLALEDPKKSVFRIYRDVRFSKDKRPYKTHLGAWISGNRKSDRAGIYVHLEPEKCMIAGGVWQPQGARLKSIREEIYYNGDAFRQIVEAPDFVAQFGGLQGDTLKTAPRGYDKNDPLIAFLRHKDFLAMKPMPIQDFMQERILTQCDEIFRAMAPLNQFLNIPFDHDGE
ncbi:DUF2461 domain-containing protein [Persicobacter psychrovividus]|uniref:TIGR02453 family protein n=1 Tax=Persicobacter psychrovividus TaxID=387638 RepID=A0ABM7VBS0_9BACT|nr:TIGR02453 family protein [Persicobacter psychrovividus]